MSKSSSPVKPITIEVLCDADNVLDYRRRWQACSHVLFSKPGHRCAKVCALKKGYDMYLPLHATLIFAWTHTHTIPHTLIYRTRIQLLNSAPGSIPPWLCRHANPLVISSDSLHPLSSCTKRSCFWPPIRTWLNENSDAHLTFPGPMNTNERHVLLAPFWAFVLLFFATALVTVTVCMCEWGRKRERERVNKGWFELIQGVKEPIPKWFSMHLNLTATAPDCKTWVKVACCWTLCKYLAQNEY